MEAINKQYLKRELYIKISSPVKKWFIYKHNFMAKHIMSDKKCALTNKNENITAL